jgi:hypothetical protein
MRALSKEPHSAMTRILALLSLAVAAISFSSCDKHSWKDTQVLHEKYSGHGKADGGHEGAKEGHAAPAAGHGAKPEAAKH